MYNIDSGHRSFYLGPSNARKPVVFDEASTPDFLSLQDARVRRRRKLSSMRRSQSHSEDVAHAPGVVIDIPICAQLMLLQAGVGFLAAKSRQGAESVG